VHVLRDAVRRAGLSVTADPCRLPQLHLTYSPAFGAFVGVTSLEFCRDLRHQKTRIPGLSCGVVCVILRLAVSVEHRLVTDGQTDTTTANTRAASIARVPIEKDPENKT